MALAKIIVGESPVLADREFRWALTSGAQFFSTSCEFTPEDAAKIIEKKQPLTIAIQIPNGAEVRIEKVYCVGESPPSTPWTRTLTFADRRWLWSKNWIFRRYNVRRKSHRRRWLEGALEVPQQIRPIVDDFIYECWSLQDETKAWTPINALLNVLEELGVRPEILAAPRFNLPMEDLDIDDNGVEAVRRVLGYLPGTDLYVALDGSVCVYESMPGRAKFDPNLIEPLEQAGMLASLQSGKLKRLDFSLARPEKIEIGFTREIEVRFDSRIEVDGTAELPDEDARELVNVLPVTDQELEVNGQIETMGAWIPVSSAFAAWGPASDEAPTLTHKFIQTQWFNDQTKRLYSYGGSDKIDIEVHTVWARRIAALQSSYRTSYRINPRWVDRASSIRAYRLALLDYETGTLAPATVYADYCVRPTMRTLENGQGDQAWNVPSYPDSGLLKDGSPAPALLSVVDERRGIIRIDYRNDYVHFGLNIIPSRVASIPKVSPVTHAIDWPHAALDANHRIALVLTMIPGGPNNDANLLWIPISPNQSERFTRELFGPCRGPAIQTRIRPAQQTAWYGWVDSAEWAQKVADAFGVDGRKPPADLGVPLNSDRVSALSLGEATAIYLKLLDHYVGSQAIPFTPMFTPTGEIRTVTHVVRPDGARVTTLTAETPPATIQALHLLPGSIRKIVMRLVEQ